MFRMSRRDVEDISDLETCTRNTVRSPSRGMLSAYDSAAVKSFHPRSRSRQVDAPPVKPRGEGVAESRCTRNNMQAISVQLRSCVRATPLPLINARILTIKVFKVRASETLCRAALSKEIQNQQTDGTHVVLQTLAMCFIAECRLRALFWSSLRLYLHVGFKGQQR